MAGGPERFESRVDACGHGTNQRLVLLVLFNARAGGRRNLNKSKAADPVWIQFQQTFYRPQAFEDALGVVEAINTDAELVLGRQVVQPGGWSRGRTQQSWPSFPPPVAMRWRSDTWRTVVSLATERHGERFPVDAGFKKSIHGIDKIVAVELGMKAQNAAAQQTREQFFPPWANGERLRIWPREYARK
jgi:hypothetical protein